MNGCTLSPTTKDFVDPNIPLSTADQVRYPRQYHEAAREIRAGLLERKSKHLKDYTTGWCVIYFFTV